MDVSNKDYAINPQQKDEAGGDLPYLREHRRNSAKVKSPAIWSASGSAASRKKDFLGLRIDLVAHIPLLPRPRQR